MSSPDWFTECADMKQRFPDLEDGIEIHEKIMGSPLVVKTNVTIPWYDTDGRKWTFVQQHAPRFFNSMLSFECAAATCKHLKQKGWYESFLHFMDACTLWDDNRLDNQAAIDVIHKWALALSKFNATDEFALIAFLEGVRFMLPTVPVSPKLDGVKVVLSGRQVNMFFTKESDAKSHMLHWIHAPMKDSVVYKDADGSKEPVLLPEKRRGEDAVSSTAASKKRKTTTTTGPKSISGSGADGNVLVPVQIRMTGNSESKALLQAHEESSAMDGLTPEDADGADDPGRSSGRSRDKPDRKTPTPTFAAPQSRDIQWFDDMMLSCISILASHGLCMPDGSHAKQETSPQDDAITRVRQQLFAVCVSTGLSFVWGKEVSIGSKCHTKWSATRKALLTMIDEAARKSMQNPGDEEVAASAIATATGASGPNAPAAASAAKPVAWADELLKACDESLDNAAKKETISEAKQMEARAVELMATHGALLDAHIGQYRPVTPIQMEPCFASAQQTVWGTCEASAKDGKLDMASVVEAMMYAVESTHTHKVLALASLLQDHKPADMPAALAEAPALVLAQVAKSRANFIVQLFKGFVALVTDAEADSHAFAETRYETLRNQLSRVEGAFRDRSSLGLLRDFDAGTVLKSNLPFEDHVEAWQKVFIEITKSAGPTLATALGKKVIEDKMVAMSNGDNGKGARAQDDDEDDKDEPRESQSKGQTQSAAEAQSPGANNIVSFSQILTCCHPEEAPEYDPPEGLEDDSIPINDISDSEFNMSILQPVLAQIEATLYSMAFMPESMENYDRMKIDITQKVTTVMCHDRPQNLTWFPFAGKVSINKTPMVIQWNDVQLPIYVNGDKHKSLASECPAVSVGASNMNLVRKTAKVDMSQIPGWPDDDLAILVPGLEAHPEWVPPGKAASDPWEMTRPNVQVKKPVKDKDAKGKDASKSKAKAAANVFLYQLRAASTSAAQSKADRRMFKNINHILKPLYARAYIVVAAKSYVNQDLDNGSPNDDHRAACVDIEGCLKRGSQRPRLQRLRFDGDKIRSESGRHILEQACASFVQPVWATHPDEHYRLIQEHMLATLKADFAIDGSLGHASYIPDEVWDLRQQKNRLRSRTKNRRDSWRLSLRDAWAIWRNTDKDDTRAGLRHRQLMYELVAAAVRFATHRIKTGIAKAKDQFLRKVATEGHQNVGAIMQRAKRAGLGAKARKPFSRELPKLLDPNSGRAASCAEDRDDIWLRHFGDQEAGTIKSTQDFIEEVAAWQESRSMEWEWQHLPSTRDLERVMRGIKPGKAAGLDQIPSDVLCACPVAVTRLLQPLYMKALLLGRQPIQWRGGVLFESYKHSGQKCLAENYRSLYISSFPAKALHRAMRRKVDDDVEAALHPLHCGTRPGLPISFSSMYVASHLRRCAKMRKSAAVLFVDTRSAYYRLVRDLVVGDLRLDRSIEELFYRFGMDGEDISELWGLIREGGMLQQAGTPEPIKASVQDFHQYTWFTSRFSAGDKLCHSVAGSRPGASWADCVFAFLYTRILHRVHEVLVGEEINGALPYDPEGGPFSVQPEGESEPMWDTTWADDTAYVTEDDEAPKLLCKVSRITSVVITAFRAHGLDPNLKRNKTSVLLRLCGKGATTVRRQVFGNGRPLIYLPDLDESVHVVLTYKHLGAMLDPTMALRHEHRYRTAMASTAYDSAKDLLLQNRDLSLETRTSLFRSAVVSTYFNLELWVPGGPSWDLMCDNFSRTLRRLLCREVTGDAFYKIPLPLAHWATGCWPLDYFARRARISTLISMVRSGPPLLWAMLQNEATWCKAVREDLRWLVGQDAEQWPEVTRTAWPQWWHVLRQQPERVKRRVARRNADDFLQFQEETAVHVCLWYMYKMVATVANGAQRATAWTCRMCQKTFRKRSGLGVHFFKTHGRQAEYREFLEGSRCKACNCEFWTQGRLEDHLRASTKCVRTLRRTFQPNQQAPPGYGSIKRRREEAANFTPAAPKPVGEPLPQTDEVLWNRWQKSLYREISDATLDGGSEEGLEKDVYNAIRKQPLYPEEIQQVVETLISEIEGIHADKDLGQWDEQEFVTIVRSIREGQAATCRPEVTASQEENDLLKRQAFHQHMGSVDWTEVLSAYLPEDQTSQTEEHGTLRSSLFILPDNWEAEWNRGRGELLNSAVLRDPVSLLPNLLREAWDCVVKKHRPTVRAPGKFWAHPVAAPFRPFRDDCKT
ncbi:unnamed protein product [Symbiodinium sp. CCMP2592]|nr:unnamed protein product [Symbiodinium sp. CCMP2592]